MDHPKPHRQGQRPHTSQLACPLMVAGGDQARGAADVGSQATASETQTDVEPALDDRPELVLDEFGKTLIDVNGHTDSTGSLNYNLSLSDSRARSVANYLSSQGVDNARIYTQGFGPNHPIADNATPDGRTLNRRVELILKPITQG